MSKKAKSAAREYRRRMKLARKQQARAEYERLRDEGRNSKSKRFVLRGKRTARSRRLNGHSPSPCGNVGCERCSGVTFSSIFFRDGEPHRMPPKMYQKWIASRPSINLGGYRVLM